MAETIETLFARAVEKQNAGDGAGAVALYRRILSVEGRYAVVHANLGAALMAMGDARGAVASYRRALALEPDRFDTYNNLGNALFAQGRHGEAERCFRDLLERAPDNAAANNNLGLVLLATGRAEDAAAAFARALTLAPGSADAHANLGNAQKRLGAFDQAAECYHRALAITPTHSGALNSLAALYHEQGRIDRAVTALEKALAVDSDSQMALRNLAGIYEEQGRIGRARACFGRLAALAPGNPYWTVRREGLFPYIMGDRADIARRRARFESVLDRLGEQGIRFDPAGPSHGTLKPSFNLPYHGENDLPLKRKLAALIGVPAESPEPSNRGGRPRVGFVVSPRHEGIFLKFMGGIVAGLSRERVDPFVICGRTGRDRLAAELQGTEIRAFEADLPSLVAGIRASAPDILYYFEVGTDQLNYTLPFFALAPVQCASWGFPVTTGIPAVTHFVSSALLEPDDAAAHYGERLVALPTLPTHYRRPRLDGTPDRRALGLPDDRHLYLCPQNLAKFHPDFDATIADILRRDEKGTVVLVMHRRPHITGTLKRRFRHTIADVADRITWIRPQPAERFLGVIRCADVMLDTWPFGGGNTTYEALALGTPVVTLPAAYMRGRVTLGCYRRIGVMDCVADSPARYAEIAVALGSDRAARATVSAKILAAGEALYEDESALRALEDFFTGVGTGGGGRSTAPRGTP